MSVDFYTCHNCNRTFCGGWQDIWCDKCGNHWCSLECAEEKGYARTEEDNTESESNCGFCRHEIADDGELLAYALRVLGRNRASLESAYLKERV